MSTPLEQLSEYLHTALMANMPEEYRALFFDLWADELRASIAEVTADWEISVARDRRAKWRVYVPRKKS